ncbi:MAG: hypothetical protein ACRCTJ_03615 [Brevinema sp.]
MTIFLLLISLSSYLYSSEIKINRYQIIHKKNNNHQTSCEIWYDHKDKKYLFRSKNQDFINSNETINFDLNTITNNPKIYASLITNTPKYFKNPNITLKYNRKDWRYDRKSILIEENLIPKNFQQQYSNQNILGIWYDPYTDNYFNDPKFLDIDHVLSLYHIHYSGGATWDKETKNLTPIIMNNQILVF